MNELVRLNVGGERYTTTRATLTRYPNSMLGAMFSGSLATSIDEHGCFFIDRDGPMFRHVLNFLRSGRLSLPNDFRQLDLLATEADFYQLEDLIKEILRLQTSAGGSHLEVGIDGWHFPNYSVTGYLIRCCKRLQGFGTISRKTFNARLLSMHQIIIIN